MSELKNCPFCGGTATVGANEYYDGANTFYIYCTSCGVRQTTTKIRTDEAITAWNRTLIPELCDALEKAEEKNTQLVRELSALARESVKRDMALAMMEVEVEAALREVQARESGCVYCINCPEKIIAKKKRYSHATETGIAYDNIKVNFCPMCGKRLEEHYEAD